MTIVADCGCTQGKPCSCGHSPEQCAIHCNARSPYNPGYVLPVRYDNGGDYVVYELPQTGSPEQEYLRRNARDADETVPVSPAAPVAPAHPLAPITDGINALINSDAMKAAAERFNGFRTRIAQITSGNAPQLGSTFGSSPLLGSTFGSSPSLGSPLDPSDIADRINQFADPFLQHATKLFDGFRQGFVLPTRRKRDVNAEHRNADVRMPMLRVREYESGRDKTSNDYSKYMSTSRVELKPSQNQEQNSKEAGKATQCHSCGTTLTESVCKSCGYHQPQYVEFVNGNPVSFYPGAIQADKSADNPTAETSIKPRFIYDRYGHKYLENNGNLRLIAPQYNQEAVISDQPDFAGLADILNRNYAVIEQMNHEPGRILPQPKEFVKDALDLIRDMAVQKPSIAKKRSTDETEQAMTTEEMKAEQSPMPRSMYQVVPMNYDGKDGKLVVKVYSAKNDKTKSDEATMYTSSMMDRSMPTVKKFSKNDKQFEILSFDDYKATSDEDVRRVLEHLHGKQKW